ncbi:unnamed protein product [Ilex paraguariensis]|uniref:Uncharacterized protein n=1 Tax=Ilex paraguariensis TaxID=185542 RepID=A0ABC8RSC2_9AQUA
MCRKKKGEGDVGGGSKGMGKSTETENGMVNKGEVAKEGEGREKFQEVQRRRSRKEFRQKTIVTNRGINNMFSVLNPENEKEKDIEFERGEPSVVPNKEGG